MQLSTRSTAHSLPHCSNETGNCLVLQHPPSAKLATASHGTCKGVLVFAANIKKGRNSIWTHVIFLSFSRNMQVQYHISLLREKKARRCNNPLSFSKKKETFTSQNHDTSCNISIQVVSSLPPMYTGQQGARSADTHKSRVFHIQF